MKRRTAVLASAARRVMVAQLVVDLPSNDGRVIAIAHGKLRHNVATKLAVRWAGWTSMATPAVAPTPSVVANAEHIRMLLRQPGRRRSCRRAKDDA